jgi:hypothetical protein
MNFEPMYDGALVTCSELVWQLGRSQPRLFLDPPASQNGTSGESRMLRPTSLRLLAPWAGGSMRSFADHLLRLQRRNRAAGIERFFGHDGQPNE